MTICYNISTSRKEYGITHKYSFIEFMSTPNIYKLMTEIIDNFQDKDIIKTKLNIIYKQFPVIWRDFYYLINRYCVFMLRNCTFQFSDFEKKIISGINKNYIFYNNCIEGWINNFI